MGTPGDLLAVRAKIQQYTGLVANSLGVGHATGDWDGGYHDHDANIALYVAAYGRQPYSVAESSRDRRPTENGSGLDVGDFDVTVLSGRDGEFRRRTLDGLNSFLVNRASAGERRAKSIREIIYRNPVDHTVIHRWDALGRRTSGDSSHQFHTHLSLYRDSEGQRDDLDDLLGLIIEYFEGPEPAPVTVARKDEDMGYSTPPIMIKEGMRTSLSIPKTQQDLAHGNRRAWLCISNFTEGDVNYRLRIAGRVGSPSPYALGSSADSKDGYEANLASGSQFVKELLPGTVNLEISRVGAPPAIPGGAPGVPYAGHLTCNIVYGDANV